jgi:hypothetical protein
MLQIALEAISLNEVDYVKAQLVFEKLFELNQ